MRMKLNAARFYMFCSRDDSDDESKGVYLQIMAKPIDLGVMEGDFFIHYEPAKGHEQAGWIVTEGYSGQRISGNPTKFQRGAIEQAKLFLLGVSKARFLAAIHQAIAEHGLSPRYTPIEDDAPTPWQLPQRLAA